MLQSRDLFFYRTAFAIAALTLISLAQCVVMAKNTHKEPASGEQIYKQHCAQCHADGGNSVNPTKPLAESKQLNSLPQFKAYLSAPPGHMPYYQDVANNKRVLNALYKYTKTLKKPAHQVSTTEQAH